MSATNHTPEPPETPPDVTDNAPQGPDAKQRVTRFVDRDWPADDYPLVGAELAAEMAAAKGGEQS